MEWSRVDYLWIVVIVVFISRLDSHSDGTHSLQRMHWWASDVMLNFSKSVLMKKQTHLHLGWREVECISSKFSRLSKLFLQRVLIYLDKTVYRFIWSAACHYIKWNSGLFDCPAHIWWYALCIIHYEGHLQSFGTATEQCLCVSGVFSNSIPRPSEIWIN